jgi:hypothetical protein
MNYAPGQKAIFNYYDGEGHVWGDPLQIYRLLMEATGGELGKLLEDSQATLLCPVCKGSLRPPGAPEPPRCPECDGTGEVENTPVAMPARGRLTGAVRSAFEMKPWDKTTGTGATEEDCQLALNAYLAFLNKKKETPANSQTTSPPTGIHPAGPQTMKNKSGSG